MESPITPRTRNLILNPDAAAILIALSLAALIRLNILPHIRW